MSESTFTKQQARELKETILFAESFGPKADPTGTHTMLLRFNTKRSNGSGNIESGTITVPPAAVALIRDAITQALDSVE